MLLFDFELWKTYKEDIEKFIEREEFSIKKWRNILSSIRGILRKNNEYRSITDKLIAKFFKELEDKDIL